MNSLEERANPKGCAFATSKAQDVVQALVVQRGWSYDQAAATMRLLAARLVDVAETLEAV